MERFLQNISKEDADYIETAKGTRGGDTKENIINNKLNGKKNASDEEDLNNNPWRQEASGYCLLAFQQE